MSKEICMTNEQREIHRKKRVLGHAARVGNVSKACRVGSGLGSSSAERCAAGQSSVDSWRFPGISSLLERVCEIDQLLVAGLSADERVADRHAEDIAGGNGDAGVAGDRRTSIVPGYIADGIRLPRELTQ